MIKTYFGILLAVTTVLIMTGMQASASSDSGQAENANDHGSTGNWQTVLMADGNECEGMVFESAEEAEAAKGRCTDEVNGVKEQVKSLQDSNHIIQLEKDNLKENVLTNR